MNNLVNFKVAKLLKDNNFNGETTVAYALNGNAVASDHNYNTGLGNSSGKRWWNTYEIDMFAAPLISDTVIWIYDKYGIFVSIKLYNNKFTFIIQCNSEADKFLNEYYNSINEAYQAGIEYVLTDY